MDQNVRRPRESRPFELVCNYPILQDGIPVFPVNESLFKSQYYDDLCKTAVGPSEVLRSDAINILESDPDHIDMTPRMINFITRTFYAVGSFENLSLSMRLLRLIKAFLKIIENVDNIHTLYFQMSTTLLPIIQNCMLRPEYFVKPNIDVTLSFSIRRYASKLWGQITDIFIPGTHTSRVLHLLTPLFNILSTESTLPTVYGSIAMIAQYGRELIEMHIFCYCKMICNRLDLPGFLQTRAERIYAQKIKDLLYDVIMPVLYLQQQNHPIPTLDELESYKIEFGSIGQRLLQGLIYRLEQDSVLLENQRRLSNQS